MIDDAEFAAEPREACARCGNFAELVEYDGHEICDECIGRLSEIERTPPTVANLLSGSAWVLVRIGPMAALIVALANLPIIFLELFVPDLPTFISSAWGVSVSIIAQGAVFSLAMRAIRGEELSLQLAVRRSMDVAGKLIPANLLAGIQTFLYLLLLIVPGFVRALSLALVLPIVVHEGLGPSEAIRNSVGRMLGYRAIALAAYSVWGSIWALGLAAYLGFTFALDSPMFYDTPEWLLYAIMLVSGLLMPVLMLPVHCTTAVLYAKTLGNRIY